MAGSCLHIGENGAKHVLFGAGNLAFLNLLLDRDESGNPLREAAKGQDIVDASGGDGVSRHGRIFGLFRVLDEDQSACLLDRLHPHRAIRAGAGQDDGEAVAMFARKRPEKVIDGRAPSTLLSEIAGVERAV